MCATPIFQPSLPISSHAMPMPSTDKPLNIPDESLCTDGYTFEYFYINKN